MRNGKRAAALLCAGMLFLTAGCGMKATVRDSGKVADADAAGGESGLSLPVMKGAYLELSLGSAPPPGGLSFLANTQSLLDLLRVIRKAGGDKTIQGMVLNMTGFSANREFIGEIRAALEAFKGQGKKIIAFIDHVTLDEYLLASVADAIVMDKTGSVTLLGYVYGRGYVHQALERWGVGVRELRYLEYKSAVETYTRDSLSGADREQYNAYLDDIFGVTRETLMRARSWSADEFDALLNREYFFSAEAALDRGLVDRLGRAETLQDTVEELEGKRIARFLRYGPYSLVSGAGGAYPLSSRFKGGLFRPEIAVIHASGETELDQGMGARSLARLIRETAAKSQVKALVIRIDSPGGSPDAADYVAEAIREAGNEVPVVVSMGSVAASGGYWAAVYAGHIIASPYTLTGSIGVIGSWVYDTGIYQTLGLSTDTLTRGEHADLYTGVIIPRRDLTPEEEARNRRYILDLYRNFIETVADGRRMERETVEALAQGRVYSGLEALRLGLVDGTGGLLDALDKAVELAGLPAKQQPVFREYPKPALLDTLLQWLPGLSAAVTAAAPSFPGTSFQGTLALWDQIRYRVSHNGRALAILPLELLLER